MNTLRKRLGFVVLLCGLCLPAAHAAKVGLSPVGNWECTWTGPGSKGVMYGSFAVNGTWSGYVLDESEGDFFTFTGVWQADVQGRVTGTLVHDGQTETINALVVKGGKVSGTVVTSEPATIHFNGKTAGVFPDAAGVWRGTVKTGKESFPIQLTATPMAGCPGVFLFTGQANSGPPPDLLDGGFLVTSKGTVYGGASADNGIPEDNVDLNFSGKYSATKGITLHGTTSNPEDRPFTITLTRQ